MRSSQLALLVLTALLLQGCKFWPFGGSDSDLKPPAYYGTYSIDADGSTSELWPDDAPPELPETVTFLIHEKAVRLAQDDWSLSRLSVSGPSVQAGSYSWDQWYQAHGFGDGAHSAAASNFPVNATTVRLRRRPVAGKPEMIILEPAAPLTPGPYQLGDDLRFWVARQQFNLDLSAAADAAVQDGDLRRAYNLAESAKLWNAGNLPLVAQFAEIQARIVQIDSGGTAIAAEPSPPAAAATSTPKTRTPTSSSSLDAEASFRQATTAFDNGEWALALEAALEAMKIDRASSTRTVWPNHRRFRDPIDVMLGIVTSPETADPVVVCETSKILARAGEKRAVPAMAEALGAVNLQPNPAERLGKTGVSCLVDALVALRARPATPILRNCLSHTLSDLKTRASAERFVEALVIVDGSEWRRFSPVILDKVYDQFVYVNDRGAAAVRINPIDTESPHASKIDAFLAKIGRWDVTDAANRSGLEMGGNISTKIIDRDLIEITYRITGQSSFNGDQFTLILRPHSSREMPWRVYDIRDIRIQGKPFSGDGSVVSSEFEPVSSAPIDNVSIPPISIGDSASTRPAVSVEPDIAALSTSSPGGPRIASRPPGAPPTDIVSAICPGGTIGPLRHGTWYRQYFMDDALVDVRPADDPSPEEHNETKDLINTGVDILAPEGTPVYALASGLVRTVISSENDGSFRALGYAVIVRHAQDGKSTYCLYSHLKDPPKVRTGANISAGDLIGETGSTGVADQAKVHVEIRHFNHVFDHKRFDAFGNPMTQDPTTFDMQYFNSKWSDPLQFGL